MLHSSTVSPVLDGGSGLKLEILAELVITGVSPVLDGGSGLKHGDALCVAERNAGFSRPRRREWIETARPRSVPVASKSFSRPRRREWIETGASGVHRRALGVSPVLDGGSGLKHVWVDPAVTDKEFLPS